MREQERQIRDYADEEGYELIRIVRETSADNMGFTDARRICRSEKADLLYVDMGNWNANPQYKRSLHYLHNDKLHRKAKGVDDYRIRPVAITANDRTMEAIERSARKEKYQRRRTDTRLNFRGPPLNKFHKWKEERNIGDRRFKNFEHLAFGARSIFDIISRNVNVRDLHIAEHLDREDYLTVDGKRWTKDNVRKTRALITSTDFLEFVDIRKEEKQD